MTALALQGAASAERSEVLVASPQRFEPFEHDGLLYRRARPWPEDALLKLSVGTEFVRTTGPERTLGTSSCPLIEPAAGASLDESPANRVHRKSPVARAFSVAGL